jgi:tetratricopeptide (TPR) repeat protein
MTQVTPDQAVQLGWQHLEGKRPAEAETIFRQVLAHDANNVGAVMGLATIAVMVGHPDAEGMVARLVAALPNEPQAWFLQGNLHRRQGRAEDAITSYRKALSIAPRYLEAIGNLGDTLQLVGRHEEAAAIIRQAVGRWPDLAPLRYNLGNALWAAGQRSEAIASYRTALQIDPNFVIALSNLGNALKETGQIEESIACHKRCVELEPGVAMHRMNLSVSVQESGDAEGAVDLCRQAIAISPQAAEPYAYLATALEKTGQRDQAIEQYRKSIDVHPSYPLAHTNLGLTLLLMGQFEEGWRQFEWRWETEPLARVRRRYTKPRWDGTTWSAWPGHDDRPEGTLLLHGEQGIGDSIQFVRFARQIASRGWRVILECHSKLGRLFRANDLGLAEVVEPFDHAPPAVEYDAYLPIASLPLILGEIDPRTSPAVACGSYLRADPALEQIWKDRIGGGDETIKVALVWGGNPSHVNDRGRSIPLSRLGPLVRPGVRFFSLQIGNAAEQASAPPEGMELIDLTKHIEDFADSAAMLASMDLLISVDTAAAHLAGAMGRPVWIPLPFAPDWRWMLQREDSPWYPTARLFRQEKRDQWDQPIQRMAEALAQFDRRAVGPETPPVETAAK